MSSLPAGVPILVVASAPWDTPFPVNAHQVARRFAERGHRVLFVESTGLRPPAPSSPADLRRIAQRLRRFAGGTRSPRPGLEVLSPLALPGARRGWVRSLSRRLLGLQVARAARRLGGTGVLWSFLPTGVDLVEPLRPRLVVYHCVDHYAANPGVDAELVEALEARMLARADRVLASSAALAGRLRARRADVELVENVADVALFSRALEEPLAEPPDLAAVPRPRAVYAGNLAAYRVDPELLLACAERPEGLQVVLIGAEGFGDVERLPERWRALRAHPAVHALGPKAHAELPAYLRHCQVALIPFLVNDHTRGSLPLKLWEYLAAGLLVVARSLPNLEAWSAPGVLHTAPDAATFAEAAARAAAETDPDARAARSRRAREHGWEARMDRLSALAGEALAARERG